jgi:hypothetical protein
MIKIYGSLNNLKIMDDFLEIVISVVYLIIFFVIFIISYTNSSKPFAYYYINIFPDILLSQKLKRYMLLVKILEMRE